jgi:predicted glycoside hydrolase/deacetylase ChbG (UPF0249 family)
MNQDRNQSSGPRVIVHADDFGETVEITRGICTAIEAGAVTSTSIMANMPATEDALRRVPALAARASFGVHLNLCEGKPLTSGRSLTDANGCFFSKRNLFLRSVSGSLSPAELEAEITAQIACVHDAGIRISHVDGHKHLHQLPMVAAAVATVLPRFGIERVRVTRLARLEAVLRPATLVREVLAWKAAATFSRAQLRSPRRVVDLQSVMRRGGQPEDGALWDATRVVELFCHPGTALADIEKPGSCQRHAELEFLLSEGFRQMLKSGGVQLVSYWDI